MSEYTLNQYQKDAYEYRVPSSPPEERIFGLLEESGEVAGVFKRMMRGDYTPDIAATKLAKELGDILWYLSQVAADNDWELEDIARDNIEKLESRKIRNTILGAGDDR
jgi:NTP pyrophosphatase (non-canonical NTP hydrolase)